MNSIAALRLIIEHPACDFGLALEVANYQKSLPQDYPWRLRGEQVRAAHDHAKRVAGRA